MRKIEVTGILLSIGEARSIAECLETLESMSGVYDEHFTKEAQRAGRRAKKIRELLKTE